MGITPEGRAALRAIGLLPSRRLPRDYAPLIRRYASQTGLALWAWNSLHANVFVLFWFISTPKEVGRELAHGIWHLAYDPERHDAEGNGTPSRDR